MAAPPDTPTSDASYGQVHQGTNDVGSRMENYIPCGDDMLALIHARIDGDLIVPCW